MAFQVYSSYVRGDGAGSGSGTGSGDLLLNFTIAANGDTGRTLPANALVKSIVLKGTAAATIKVGSAGDAELLVPEVTIAANVRESFAPFVSLPAVLPIFAAGIVGIVSITFVYQIVTI